MFDIVGNVLKQMYGNSKQNKNIGRGLFQWLGGDANELIIFCLFFLFLLPPFPLKAGVVAAPPATPIIFHGNFFFVSEQRVGKLTEWHLYRSTGTKGEKHFQILSYFPISFNIDVQPELVNDNFNDEK